MRRTIARIRVAATAARGSIFARLMVVAVVALCALPGLQSDVTAEEGGQAPPEGGLVPAPAGTDLETLRKLLGLPSRAAQDAEKAPAAAPAPPPTREVPAEVEETAPEPAPTATKGGSRAKPVAAKPAPKKPSKAVVKSAPKAAAEPVEAAKPSAAPVASGGAPAEGSPQDIPPPGTVVSIANLDRWKHLLGPSIQWAVSRGATLPVIAATPAPIEPFREEATRKYSSQVELTPDKNSMRNFVAGIPFPLVNDDDPDVAIKMMFNFENRISVDDVAVHDFSCDTGRIPPGKSFEIERHYITENFRRLFYVNRFHVDPKPTWPNSEGIRYREMLGAVQEPFDLKGAGFTYIRYVDPGRPDDSWLYFPQFKRVRRLSSAQRSEGVFGQDIDLDSYAGYAGNPAWSDWKYLGKKTVLGVMHAKYLPSKFLKSPAEFFPDDQWEPREVYILLAVSRLGGYNFGQRVLYLDREGLLIPYTEIYDLKGALWKSLVQTWSFGKKPIPTAKKAVYDYDQFYIPSLAMMDIQQNHATRCQLPDPDSPGEEGWYYNMGPKEGTTEAVFAVSHFIESGR